MEASIRTFVCGLLSPGLGYWIVGKHRFAWLTVLAMFVGIFLFSWSRLVHSPAGFGASIACLVVLVAGSALHAAVIEYRGIGGDRGWRQAVLFAVAVVAAVFALLSFRGELLGYEAYRLPGRSMAPTLQAGDSIVVDTWRYDESGPAMGDIVVFRAPGLGTIYAKRIVGLPGDRVSLLNRRLMRNDEVVDESYATYLGSEARQAMGEWIVPVDQYLVLGDNRNNSKDSRHFGMIPRENLIGKVSVIY